MVERSLDRGDGLETENACGHRSQLPRGHARLLRFTVARARMSKKNFQDQPIINYQEQHPDFQAKKNNMTRALSTMPTDAGTLKTETNVTP